MDGMLTSLRAPRTASGTAALGLPRSSWHAQAVALLVMVGSRSPLEGAVRVQSHQGAHTGREARAAAGHRRRLQGLEELALGGAVLGRPPHVGDETVLAGASEGQDADDHHLAVLDAQRLALADRQVGEGLARPDVVGIL